MKKDRNFILKMLEAASENNYLVEVENMTGGSYGCLPEEGEPYGSGFSITFSLSNPHEWNPEQFDAVSKVLQDFSENDRRFSKNMAKEEREAQERFKELMEGITGMAELGKFSGRNKRKEKASAHEEVVH